jgi:hypothetical protein
MKAYDSVRMEGEVFYDILIEFVVFMEPVRLIKMCLSEPYGKVRRGKHLPDTFPTRNGLKQDALSPFLFNFG